MAAETSVAGRGSGADRFAAQFRNLAERVRRLENRRTLSVGAWRITEDSDGNLVATNSNTSKVVILGSPQ